MSRGDKNGGGRMLVDMVKDPFENINILNEKPELQKKMAKLWNDWNAKNEPNKYLPAGAYQKARLNFYEDLRKKLDEAAAKEKLLVID
ncbi:hypothetical protein BN863_21140 [Formosa agariphila KMM 3901]|uniref:Uncharacterized protein n=1 Tax=Formosa agariphila (strain DSM 15362 / KCTC 12365 / LMG 23005 / KMM 3901 / M-2Alg 35-1) TaxID=1347342 RepID=T2KN26_FORAG|nr:hypothetical protein [Formosa agariphila]CDF79826.1 hypothetical protein BN863_21140 [Formosa agariphila KMM 3901]